VTRTATWRRACAQRINKRRSLAAHNQRGGDAAATLAAINTRMTSCCIAACLNGDHLAQRRFELMGCELNSASDSKHKRQNGGVTGATYHRASSNSVAGDARYGSAANMCALSAAHLIIENGMACASASYRRAVLLAANAS